MKKSLLEVIADVNAIKTERAHTRVLLPDDAQADENFRLIAELLAGSGIDQGELAGVSLEVAASAVESVARAGEIDTMALVGLVGSIWVDGIVVGVRYLLDSGRASAIRPGDEESAPEGTDDPEAGE